MCIGNPPKPQPLPDRQAAQAPPIDAQTARSDQRQQARQGFSRMILTPTAGLAPAVTTGKTLLGA